MGFEHPSYSIEEEQNVVLQVCAVVQGAMDRCLIGFDFNITLNTEDRTAGILHLIHPKTKWIECCKLFCFQCPPMTMERDPTYHLISVHVSVGVVRKLSLFIIGL